MIARWVTLILGNLLVFAVLAEAAAVVVYYYQTGHLFYGHERAEQTIAGAAFAPDRRLTADALHPYFGPSHKPGDGVNNFGFLSPRDYPVARSRDAEYLVGIFGGSVGVWFCRQGVERLFEGLRRHPFFAGRELVPLCFSHEGYKQPQQLVVLAYFLSIAQELDLAINIDGFNEVALGALNAERGLDVSMPSVMHLEPLMNVADRTTLTAEKLRALAEVERLRRELNAATARVRAAPLASLHIAWEQYRKRLAAAYDRAAAAFAALPSEPADSIIHPTPSVRSREGAALFADITAAWVRASTMMRDLLAARGAAYVHVLQPNQYYTKRTFGEAEARVAINADSPFKPGAEAGYPLLAGPSGVGELRRVGVHAFSGVDIFDRERSAVYMDNCCHYTELGNRMLADFIAAAIRDLADAGRLPR